MQVHFSCGILNNSFYGCLYRQKNSGKLLEISIKITKLHKDLLVNQTITENMLDMKRTTINCGVT